MTITNEDLERLHKESTNNEEKVRASTQCGCFYCLTIFSPSCVTDVYRGRKGVSESTVLCPYCDVDSVIPDGDGTEITRDLLIQMKKKWFES